MEVNPEYNFYANEGESFLEMEDRQINWQLQQDIAEAEMIITHLDQKGNEYGIDLDESSVGGPLPPPGFLDDDEDDGIDIRELLYNPDDPNDRSIRGTPPPSQISRWTWMGITSFHRRGATKASRLIFKLIDFTILTNMLNRAGYNDPRYHKKLIAIREDGKILSSEAEIVELRSNVRLEQIYLVSKYPLNKALPQI